MIIKAALVKEQEDSIRLDRWFSRHHPEIPYIILVKLLRKGQIRVNGKRARSSTKLEKEQIIKFPLFDAYKYPIPNPQNFYLVKNFSSLKKQFQSKEIVHDSNIIALDKPSGVAVQGGTKVKFSLDELYNKIFENSKTIPKIVHRLDKDTSGVFVIAKGYEIAAAIGKLFASRAIKKVYIALLQGVPKKSSGIIKSSLQKQQDAHNFEHMKSFESEQKQAITKYKVLNTYKDLLSLVKLYPLTGRTHQLRVHALDLNCPIVGDRKYRSKTARNIINSKELLLHASSIEFTLNEKFYSIKAALPDYFKKICDKYNLTT